MRKKLGVALIAIALLSLTLVAQQLTYPDTARGNQVDTYFGERVVDPYRWLEDDNAPDTT